MAKPAETDHEAVPAPVPDELQQKAAPAPPHIGEGAASASDPDEASAGYEPL